MGAEETLTNETFKVVRGDGVVTKDGKGILIDIVYGEDEYTHRVLFGDGSRKFYRIGMDQVKKTNEWFSTKSLLQYLFVFGFNPFRRKLGCVPTSGFFILTPWWNRSPIFTVHGWRVVIRNCWRYIWGTSIR